MAFTLTEKDGFSWTTSDVLGGKHMFTRRLSGVGENPFFSDPEARPPEELLGRIRALWLRFRDAGGFPAEGFCLTHQVHGTLVRPVTSADRRIPPLSPPVRGSGARCRAPIPRWGWRNI